jgi:hypothetical protein
MKEDNTAIFITWEQIEEMTEDEFVEFLNDQYLKAFSILTAKSDGE